VNEVLYYTGRTLLVVGWLLLAGSAWRLRATARNPWTGIALAAALFASVRAWPWNYRLLDGARAVLRGFGVYDERLAAKIVVGALLVIVVVSLVRSLRRVRWSSSARGCALATGVFGCLLAIETMSLRRGRWSSSARGCALATGVFGCLLAIETMSLDEALPGWLLEQPVRYLFEGACVIAALLAARDWRRSS